MSTLLHDAEALDIKPNERLREFIYGPQKPQRPRLLRDPEAVLATAVHPYAKAVIAEETNRLRELPDPWHEGAGWDITTFEVACNLIEIANSPWAGYSVEDALADLLDNAPRDSVWGEREIEQKWRSASSRVGDSCRSDPGPVAGPVPVPGVLRLTSNQVSGVTAPAPSGSGLYTDLAGLLRDGLPDPPKPDVCRRSDGHALFYSGQVNILFGDPESGKTWIAFVAAAEALTGAVPRTATQGVRAQGTREIEPPQRVALIDADHNGAAQIVSRLAALGVPEGVLADPDRLRLYEPEDGAALRAMVAEAVAWRPTLAVVDSVGEIMSLLGLGSNDADDYTKANRAVLTPLAGAGVCVVGIDHLAKGAESRQAGASGTAAKRRTVGGVSLRVTLREAFVAGSGGAATLTINKDRPSGLRSVCPPMTGKKGEQPAGIFILEDAAGALSWRISAPLASDALSGAQIGGRWTPSDADLAEADSLSVDGKPPTIRAIRDGMGVGGEKAKAIQQAWLELVPSTST